MAKPEAVIFDVDGTPADDRRTGGFDAFHRAATKWINKRGEERPERRGLVRPVLVRGQGVTARRAARWR